MNNTYIYLALMSLTTFIIRVLPLTLIRKQITNPFLKSFLFYVPYVTLAVMTFPAIIYVTKTPISGAFALITGTVLAWKGASLFRVSACCYLVVFLTELFLC